MRRKCARNPLSHQKPGIINVLESLMTSYQHTTTPEDNIRQIRILFQPKSARLAKFDRIGQEVTTKFDELCRVIPDYSRTDKVLAGFVLWDGALLHA